MGKKGILHSLLSAMHIRIKPRAKVAIFVRIKDRISFLKRALISIQSQTEKDWHILILNDGEFLGEIQKTLADLGLLHSEKATVLNINPRCGRPCGRSYNVGLANSQSEYFAIHDDDDTWHTQFLERTIQNLEESNEAAVMTKCMRVYESWNGDDYVETSREIYNAWQTHGVSLFRMAEANTIAPISLLVRRNVIETIGGFEDDVFILEDWVFFLKLAASFEIAYLPEVLANYHARVGNVRDEIDKNVTTTDADFLGRMDLKIRNDLLRKDIASGKIGLGFLTNLARNHGHLYSEIQNLTQKK